MPSRGSRGSTPRAPSQAESPEARREARKARRQENRREALLEAAREVLARHGVSGLMMEAVACNSPKTAGMAQAILKLKKALFTFVDVEASSALGRWCSPRCRSTSIRSGLGMPST